MLLSEGEPHWQHLETWFKLAHAHEFGPLNGIHLDDGHQEGAVKGQFESVMALSKFPWKLVTRILPGLRRTLVAVNPGWAVDHVQHASETAVTEGGNEAEKHEQLETSGDGEQQTQLEDGHMEEDQDIDQLEQLAGSQQQPQLNQGKYQGRTCCTKHVC
jgi:hypothetical protein